MVQWFDGRTKQKYISNDTEKKINHGIYQQIASVIMYRILRNAVEYMYNLIFIAIFCIGGYIDIYFVFAK